METTFDTVTICPECNVYGTPEQMLTPCPRDGRLRVPFVDWYRQKGDPLIGRVVAERYAVIGLVGRGGMGDVYRAVQLPLGRQVALKVIRPDFPDAEWSRVRFMEEAKRVAGIQAPGVVTLHDYGIDADGRLFMAFELLRGQTLDELIGLHGTLPPARVAHLGAQIATVLARVHNEGVLHWDLKPANVMCVERPFEEDEVKLLDFGLSRLIVDAGRHTGLIMGTLEYMAPEQLDDGPCDARTDLYGLAGLLFRLVMGYAPFGKPGNSVDGGTGEVALRKRSLPAPMLPGAPPALAAVLRRALSPRPEHRYADATQMATALREAAATIADAPAVPAPVTVGLPETRPQRPQAVSASAQTLCLRPEAPRRHPWRVVVAAAAAVVASAVAAIAIVQAEPPRLAPLELEPAVIHVPELPRVPDVFRAP